MRPLVLAGILEMALRLEERAHAAETETERRAAWRERNCEVYMALSYATHFGYACGIRIDPDGTAAMIACIHLPEIGQISFRLLPFPDVLDRISTTERASRITRFAALTAQGH